MMNFILTRNVHINHTWALTDLTEPSSYKRLTSVNWWPKHRQNDDNRWNSDMMCELSDLNIHMNATQSTSDYFGRTLLLSELRDIYCSDPNHTALEERNICHVKGKKFHDLPPQYLQAENPWHETEKSRYKTTVRRSRTTKEWGYQMKWRAQAMAASVALPAISRYTYNYSLFCGHKIAIS